MVCTVNRVLYSSCAFLLSSVVSWRVSCLVRFEYFQLIVLCHSVAVWAVPSVRPLPCHFWDWYNGKATFAICVYCLNCFKFSQLILRKITKIVATRCQILRVKYTQIYSGPRLCPVPKPRWKVLQRSAKPLTKGTYFKTTSNGRGGRGKIGRERGNRKHGWGDGRGEDGGEGRDDTRDSCCCTNCESVAGRPCVTGIASKRLGYVKQVVRRVPLSRWSHTKRLFRDAAWWTWQRRSPSRWHSSGPRSNGFVCARLLPSSKSNTSLASCWLDVCENDRFSLLVFS